MNEINLNLNKSFFDERIVTSIGSYANNVELIKEIISDNFENLNKTDFKKKSMLIRASECRSFKLCSTLIDCDCDMNIIDFNKNNALSVLLKYKPGDDINNIFKISKLLIENGIDINHPNELNETPLIIACKSNNYSMVEFLLMKNADFIALNSENKTVFDIAREHKFVEIMNLLKTYYHYNF